MTDTPDVPQSSVPPDPESARRSLRVRSRLGGTGIALTDVALIVLPFLLAGWLVATTGGLRALAAAARWALPALQQVEVDSGSLLASPGLRSLRYDDGSTRIDAHGLVLDWHPLGLPGRLDIARLSLAELRVATTASDVPPAVPASLSLPVAVRAQLEIARIALADYAHPDVDTLVLTSGRALLDSDGKAHRLSGLALTTPWGTLGGQATLGGDAPFALAGELAFAGGDYTATATLAGTLAGTVGADVHARGFGLSGDAHARLRPFAVQPLSALRLALDEFDPRRLHAAAPSGRWRIEADLHVSDADALTLVGPVHAENGAPGRIDQDRVPVLVLTAQLEASLGQVDLRDLRVRPAGGGEVRGEAGWRASGDLPVRAALQLRDVDAAALHGRGVPTKLGGRIDIRASGERQQFELALNDSGPSHIALDARGAVAQRLLTLERARIAARGAEATLAGSLKLDDTLEFKADGALQKFDPSAFARVPAASLSATFAASGRIGPQPDVRAAVDFGPSTLMGERLSGVLKGRLQGSRLSDADIALDWAGNSLSAHGAFGGTAADALDWAVDAQHPGALRALTGLALSGRISGSGRLAGTLATPHGTLQLSLRALSLGERGSIARADLEAGLAPGKDGQLHLSLDAADLRSPALPAPVERTRIAIDGTRAAHGLSLDVQMAEQRAEQRADRGDKVERQSLRVAAHGALGDRPSWSGVLDSLTLVLSPELTATLSRSARLSASATSVALDDAMFALTGGGELQLAHTAWTPERLEATGRARGFPLRMVWRDRAAGVAVRAPLRLGADWSLTAALSGGETVDGRLAVFREAGTVTVSGEGRMELAITDARAQAVFAGRSADVSGVLSGPDIGEARARVAVPLRRDGSLWSADMDAPTSGEATLDVPSLAWIGRALRLDMTTAGRVRADVKLAGRLGAPDLSGRIDGDDLAFALADAGLRLERGQLRAQFAGDRLKLEDLSFDSGNLRPPKDARLNGARLAGEPGRLSASGAVDVATARSDIAIKVHRFVPLQGGDQWLMLSGDGTVSGSAADGLKLKLGLVADAGLFTVPEQSPPSLGDDVVIKGRKVEEAAGPPLALDIGIDFGDHLFFRGRGLDTRLTGRLALRDDGRGLRASGNIQAVDGRYRAYGQNLVIERGVISFQGSVSNPGLNVRAIRPDLPVQAGVEVSGTVQRPRVRLVSDSAMPDSEKLSWIVLGRGQDSAAGSDLSLLATAASALLGGEGEGITGSLAQALGLDQIALTQATTSTGPRSQVVSTSGSTTTVGGQVVSVGKRLTSNALLTYEQGVAGATSIVKLTWNLSRRLALIGSTGTEQAVDVRYVFSFK